jgi:hypothetical protein
MIDVTAIPLKLQLACAAHKHSESGLGFHQTESYSDGQSYFRSMMIQVSKNARWRISMRSMRSELLCVGVSLWSKRQHASPISLIKFVKARAHTVMLVVSFQRFKGLQIPEVSRSRSRSRSRSLNIYSSNTQGSKETLEC